MKRNQTRYISRRVFLFVLATLALVFLLLLELAVVAVIHGRYFVPLGAGLALAALLFYAGNKFVLEPYRETCKMMQLFSAGYTVQGIYELRYPISPEVDAAMQKLKAYLDTNELINATKRQAQYLALQNQINPHFLYNTLEGIRGEAIVAGLDTVAEMTEALATFFRYTISNVDSLVTLEDELSNIENYYIIQQYRFGERLSLNIVCDDKDKQKIMKYRLPKLTLQPIVENAIFHGIERKTGKGEITVRIDTTPKRLIVTISDTGLGMEPERLSEIVERINAPSFEYIASDGEKKGGIAIVNVNNRIKLLFGEEYGVNIYSTVGVGTDVEITVPVITKEMRNFP